MMNGNVLNKNACVKKSITIQFLEFDEKFQLRRLTFGGHIKSAGQHFLFIYIRLNLVEFSFPEFLS